MIQTLGPDDEPRRKGVFIQEIEPGAWTVGIVGGREIGSPVTCLLEPVTEEAARAKARQLDGGLWWRPEGQATSRRALSLNRLEDFERVEEMLLA